MSRFFVFMIAATVLSSCAAQAQVGSPGINYSGSIATGDGGQLYPYDQQDPWIHGHFQRIPAYGGHSSFRPYNYHHVFSQTQMSQRWGASHGMPYSQQFWNKYRGSYLNDNLHSPATALMPQSTTAPQAPGYSAGLQVAPAGYSRQYPLLPAPVRPDYQPIHVYPQH